MLRFFSLLMIIFAGLYIPTSKAATDLYCQGQCSRDFADIERRQVDNACVDICIDKEHTLNDCSRACTY